LPPHQPTPHVATKIHYNHCKIPYGKTTTMDIVLGVLAIAALVGMNGFFVAAEFALVSARETRIAQLADEGKAGAHAAQTALGHLDNYIAATQLGITLASLGLGFIGEPALSHIFEPLLHWLLPPDLAEAFERPVAVALSFSLVTMLHIIMGELVPKSIALQRPEDVSLVVARPTSIFLWLFRPIIYVMNGIGGMIVRAMGFEPAAGHERVHSAEELSMLVQSSGAAGILAANEEKLLQRAFEFSDTHAQQIMQPRVEVQGLNVNAPLGEVLALIAAKQHARYPIYENSIDKVIGVLYAKDLFTAIIQAPNLLTDKRATLPLRPLLRTPLFVPQTATVDKLLAAMQQTRVHFAIVIDEYGGMAGVVTLEDIIEQLIGDVQDEFEKDFSDDVQAIQADGDAVVVDGLTPLTDIREQFDDDEECDSSTIGGYVTEKLDRIPQIGDTVRFGGYYVIVKAMEGRRVARVWFTRTAPL
jgi:putative hemolysin